MRGGLPSVCMIHPLLCEPGPPCCARFATSAKSRAAVTSEETKEPQERGAERGVDMQRMRGGTAQVGSFTEQRIVIDHTSSVIKSINEPRCVYFGTRQSWKTEPQLLRRTKRFFPWLDRKKNRDHQLTKTMANFSSSSVGSGMGTFRGMMWCFISDWPSTLSMFPIFNLKGKKKLHNPPTFFFHPQGKKKPKKLPNNPKVWLTHESRGSPVRVLTEPKCGVRVPKCHLHLITRSGLQFPKNFQKETIKVRRLRLPVSATWVYLTTHYSRFLAVTDNLAALTKLSRLPDVSIHCCCDPDQSLSSLPLLMGGV